MTSDEAFAQIATLTDFFKSLDKLIGDIEQCSPVLFRAEFRESLQTPLNEAQQFVRFVVSEDSPFYRAISNPEYPGLLAAGLVGNQLQLKLMSYQHSVREYYETGEREHMEECMSKASTLLGSLAGAIPGFGSFVKELLDFLMKELTGRWTKKIRRLRVW